MSKKPLSLQPDPDCCDVWPKIMSSFSWMSYDDQPEMLSMCHIDIGGEKFFVNFCPSCGKPARNRNVLASRVNKQHPLPV